MLEFERSSEGSSISMLHRATEIHAVDSSIASSHKNPVS